MSETPNFWPKLDDAEVPRLPIKILREHAETLLNVSNGRIAARLERGISPGDDLDDILAGADVPGPQALFTLLFYVTPAGDPDYRFLLFTARMTPLGYPVEIHFDDEKFSCRSEKEFQEALAKILKSKKTKDVLLGLLAMTETA